MQRTLRRYWFLFLVLAACLVAAGMCAAGLPAKPLQIPGVPKAAVVATASTTISVSAADMTYTWDPANPYQCFNPSDAWLPSYAPRCPEALHIPADPGPPIVIPSKS